ncbi:MULTISPECIES: hypothetical protein [Chryseobacterium]|uniref:Uncharacterized protein n=2 Tax=Chryseobacterium TaxID=59732 RepID=A0ABU0TIH0_9FLAO|nr:MULTISPECIES: hypothetical protein [Chryseobacterium]MDQ1096822.1 hypothetical protein [Chryseobacterium camelliae]MDR6084207.1 hypothetical protein [Chryseobacterium sp. SORGH_AS_0909]MDR6132477.1 hypothetical protein [Chryseobacterium sp. SORGH_AS_1175]MDT3409315.1 hypothetical protein [Pseudacidovorax intermedius]
MNTMYFFSAFGTFGNPNGFRQSFFLGGNPETVKDIRTFDLKTDAIKLFPDTRIYALRKDHSGSRNLLSYAIYTFAKEQNSHRGGTFIGSGLIFAGKTASEALTIEVLNEFHDGLEKNNVSEGSISIVHSDQFTIHKPKDFDKIAFNLREVDDLNFSSTSGKYLVVYSETDVAQLQILFRKAVELLHSYDTIYFTQSHEIGQFVRDKGLFKIVDKQGFEQEISKLHEERAKLVQQSIDRLMNEKQQLEQERKRVVDDMNDRISRNEARHRENEKSIRESKEKIQTVTLEYHKYAGKMDELINALRTEGKMETVKKQHEDQQKAFAETIIKNKDIPFIDSLSSSFKSREVSASHVHPMDVWEVDESRQRSRRSKKSSVDGFKIATVVLLLLLIGSYLFYFFCLDGALKLGIPSLTD